MSVRRSLRNRVAFTLALFAGAVSLTLAVIIYLAFQDLERRLIDDTLTAELDDYVERRARNPHSLPERTATIRAFVISPAGGGTPIPKAVAVLAPGRHQLLLDGIPYYAAVRIVGAQRFVVLYDISASQRRERGFLLLLAGSVLLIMVISALAGRWLAARIIAPVTELARRVAELRPEDAPPHLADRFPWEEVQRLAADFDAYLGRLHDFIERERLFTGDISHELRTPLAIIRGATELLLADPQINQKNQDRVARIGRAVVEMGEISGALLALAREQETPALSPPNACDVEAVAAELVARYAELFRAKPIELTMTVTARPKIIADRAVLAMVLGNLLRNAMSFTDFGQVLVTLEPNGVRVEDTGQGVPMRNTSRLFQPYVRGGDSAGAGLGLSLVQRLCARQGWQVTLDNRPAGGTLARLRFSSVSGDTSAVT
jgi:signal transduction histidine kinase